MTDDTPDFHIAHCSSCGCKMDISAMGPYTNVICPDCGLHTRVKCELGQYLLTKRHAAGGMSMVFTARDITLEREVAIKVLNEDYSGDEQRMKQFEQEALITAAISHPHVVRVFTVGMEYGRYYIAMEMVAGENLEQKISREGALSEDIMLPMAAEMISGLRAAKQAGLIHRDIKPGNILFDAMGHVKIVDFGLALVTQGGTARADEIWATPYYVPPEALDGREEDFRSDIYALGATLYHALSGRPPLNDNIRTTKAVRKAKETVPSLARIAPWLKPQTCHLVDKAMALAPEDRFASYVEMEDALQDAYQASQNGGAAEPIYSLERASRRAKEKQGGKGLVVWSVVALLLVAVAIVIVVQRDADDPAPKNTKVTASPGPDNGYDPVVAQKIAEMVTTSHARLDERQYDEAREVFFKMMNDSSVREPAASWAGIEAIIATWLEGNSGDATRTISRVLKFMSGRNAAGTEVVQELGRQLSEPGLIREVNESRDSMGVVHLMAVALKNWEMGAWESALPVFEKVGKHPLPEGSPLLVYRKIAARYLDDYILLKPYEDMRLPDDIDTTRKKLDELTRVMGALKTRGRARFHVQIWQLRLHRHIRALRGDSGERAGGVGKAPRFVAVMPKYHKLTAGFQYAEASELLRDVIVEKHQEQECEAWIYLADSARVFLVTLEEVVPKSGIRHELEAKNGKKYQRVIRSKSGGLDLIGPDGEVFVAWRELKPESILSLHQKTSRQTLATLEGQLRTEQAICFAWLSGLKDKAQGAARVLSQTNKKFKRRWDGVIQAVDRVAD